MITATRPPRTVIVAARPCHDCGTRILIARCFDNRTRIFDTIQLTGTDLPAHDRWWLSRTCGMVNAGVTAGEPAAWVRQHRCRPLVPDTLGQALDPDRPHASPPRAPAAAEAAPAHRYGYRWAAGPAHVLRDDSPGAGSAAARTWCRARVRFGEAPREQARAAAMPACPACLYEISRRGQVNVSSR
jgi:hypothetical protein